MPSNFIPAEVINCKRRGEKLAAEQIHAMIDRYHRGAVLPQQMAAFAMAVCTRGMDAEETTELTRAMWQSGETLHWSPGPPRVDKHSTGGIGDKISIPLAPILASLGMQVPMISGRGLDFTGGTLDKLESIAGYRTDLPLDTFQQIASRVGCSINGATKQLAPADQKLYLLRNESGTVESIPLITASILSKKLAAGLDALVLDVKCGSGAFMQQESDAIALASSLVEVGNRLGMKTRALVTDMNQPLGQMVGNALEIDESVEILRGQGPADVLTLTIRLAVELLEMTGRETDRTNARAQVQSVIANGRALSVLREMVTAHGGDLDAPRVRQPSWEFVAQRNGFVQAIDGRSLGYALIAMGGGRADSSQTVDSGVGFQIIRHLGQPVHRGDVLARVFCGGARDAILDRLQRVFVIGEQPVPPHPLIRKTIDFDPKENRLNIRSEETDVP